MDIDFAENLLRWHHEDNTRQMPWKGEKNPYRIWISEIILQQTRVEQGEAYYRKFINRFPDIQSLAQADDAEVFKLWEGLGYYTRCKNLLLTARHIANELRSEFPSTYNDILKLKGVGPYTAAAIASFAFGEPRAVLDGNVVRVLSRYFGISTPAQTTGGKQLYTTLANSLIPGENPAAYNQAIMDFGATVCRPRNPLCNICVQQDNCQAYQKNYVHLLPVKEKALAKRMRWMNYFVVRYNGYVFMRKRTSRDIWQNLHEFILLETEHELTDPDVLLRRMFPGITYRLTLTYQSGTQQLSHQTIRGNFYVVDLQQRADPGPDYEMVKADNLHEYAFPRYINSFLREHSV